jgi:hypothetical protein
MNKGFLTVACSKQVETFYIVPILLLECNSYQSSSSKQNTALWQKQMEFEVVIWNETLH